MIWSFLLNMKLTRDSWGKYDNQSTEIFTISDPDSGFLVQLTNFGATIIQVKVPDRNGKIENINFGQFSPEEYVKQSGYLGAAIGRVANRTENAKFQLNGNEYKLFPNNFDKHSLHGGKIGFNYKIWKCLKAESDNDLAELVFEYTSPDGEEGYPGSLTTKITFKITDMKIEWEFEAFTDQTTVINLTNHAYWNLNGLDELNDDLELWVNADFIMIFDEELIPTGEIAKLKGKDLDLRTPKKFSKLFEEVGDIDHNYILNTPPVGNNRNRRTDPTLVAELYSEKNGRKMSVFTTEPCLMVYSGNFMGTVSSFGKPCKKHNAVCLETQRYPNAINIPYLADSVILNPGETYFHRTRHEFSVK